MLSLLNQTNILVAKNILAESPYFLNVKHDSDSNLYLTKVCHKSDLTQSVVRQGDGTIFDAYGKVVCYSGEYGENYNYSDLSNPNIKEIEATLEQLADYEVLEYSDGTCIRVFFHNNKWCVATKGHTDAGKAKWSSDKSFLTLFQETLPLKYEELNRKYTYVYLLQHVENKIVCPVTENKALLLEVYDNTTLTRVSAGASVALNITNRKDLTIFLELAEETNKGVYCSHRNSGHRMFVVSKLYEERQRLKGNTLDMRKHYCELRHCNNHTTFLTQFPEYAELVAEVEKTITLNVRHMHSLYMAKHVRKENTELTPNERKYMFVLHGYYLRTRIKMTYKVVENLLFCLNMYFGTELM